ncbi:MAG: SUF system Fe-S cluster assembly protein [Rhodospirillaceae bacterium]|nr:SUF system Fe-S cluster assembly protein [Rhodospirillaceae bacterium]MBT5665000.1 SUF system Fe-S cluster assembly protein [Rhodospirillaceae bacterium]MBT5810131.1 SUF system Fe-S cluster assembly protein [Rhodospirillaceae bacterium]
MMPAAPEGEDAVAHAGAPLDPSIPVADSATLVAAMKTVFDPEIPVDIYELGLIYDCDIDAAGEVDIKMTLTAPTCPVAGILPGQVAEAVAGVEGVGEVTVELVWDPPWEASKMSDAAKVELDMF